MRTLRAPEIAVGVLDHMLEELLDVEAGAAVLLRRLPCQEQLMQATHTLLKEMCATMEVAKAHMRSVLMLKFDIWKRLPWVLAWLAHPKQDTARCCGREALRVYNSLVVEPQWEQHQHALTRLFLSQAPGSLRDSLDSFVDGTCLEDCTLEFQRAVAKLRFIPVAERVIEGQHAYAKRAVDRAPRHSPSDISLSLRKRDLVSVLTDPENHTEELDEYARCLQEIPSLRCAPEVLGLQHHPLLHGGYAWREMPYDTLRVNLQLILYRCCLSDQFQGWSAAKGHNEAARAREAKMRQHMPELPGQVDFSHMWSEALLQHFREHWSSQHIFTLPVSQGGLSFLQDFLSPQLPAGGGAPDRVPERDSYQLPSGHIPTASRKDTPLVFFSVLPMPNVGQLRLLSTAPGVGGRRPLRNKNMMIALHKVRLDTNKDVLLSCKLSFADSPCVLTGFPSDATLMQELFLAIPKTSNLRCRIPECENSSALHNIVVQHCVDTGAIGGATHRVRAPDLVHAGLVQTVAEATSAMEALEAQGVLVSVPAAQPLPCAGAGHSAHPRVTVEPSLAGSAPASSTLRGWQISKTALRRVEFYHTLVPPQRVCEGRLSLSGSDCSETLALEDCTVFELIQKMQTEWTWQSCTSDRQVASMPPHTPTSEKCWGAKRAWRQHPARMQPYLLALLQADRLFATIPGLTAIHHGRPPSYYEGLLSGGLAGQQEGVAAAGTVRKRKRVPDSGFDADTGGVTVVSSPALTDQGHSGGALCDNRAQPVGPHILAEEEDNDESSEQGQAGADGPSSEDEDDLLQALGEALVAESALTGRTGLISNSSGDAAPSHLSAAASGSGGGAPQGSLQVTGAQPGEDNAGVGVGEGVDPCSALGRVRIQAGLDLMVATLTSSFGEVFLFSHKKPTAKSLYGSLEATCPFHRKNSTTKCKKALQCRSDDQGHLEETGRRLKLWCARACTFEFQWQHLAYHPSLLECPPDHIIQAMAPKDKPAVLPLPDSERTAAAAVPSAPAL